jgi:hypothetical protein
MSSHLNVGDAIRDLLAPPNPVAENANSTADAETARIRFALLTIGIVFVGVVAASLHPWGWWTAALIIAFPSVLIGGFIAVRRDALLFRFLVVAAVCGWVELYADWYIIEVVPVLVYQPQGPFVASSPLYMPFGWMVVVWQLGLVGRWMDRRWGLAAATIGVCLIGGLNWPFYEYLAERAGWWHYEGVSGIGNAAFFAIVAEALFVAALPLAFRITERRGPLVAIGVGTALGAWTFVAAKISLALFG